MYSFPKIAGLATTHCYHGDLALTFFRSSAVVSSLYPCMVYVISRQTSVSSMLVLSHGSARTFVVACRSRSHVVSALRYIIDERLTEPFRRDDFYASWLLHSTCWYPMMGRRERLRLRTAIYNLFFVNHILQEQYINSTLIIKDVLLNILSDL